MNSVHLKYLFNSMPAKEVILIELILIKQIICKS